MKLSTAIGCAAVMAAVMPASAGVVVLDFEGAGDSANLLNFYNGGADSGGHSGVNYGVTFSANALALIDSDAGGTGSFANEPSASTAMFFLSTSATIVASAVVNYAAGFSGGFAFYYSSAAAALVNIYDGLDATGNLLGTIAITDQFAGNNCQGDPSGVFCNWTAVGTNFSGVAKSIDFGGALNQTAFDNVTFGSPTVGGGGGGGGGQVPEPSTVALVGLALAGLGLMSRRRI